MTPPPNFVAQPGAKKLGRLLVERGWITGEQLIRAIQSQRMVGGRLGTCLLEMDVLSEERLLAALGDQLGVPSIRIDQLRSISEELLGLVPAQVALRCEAVPFHASSHEIDVATLNVGNLAFLDELSFCTNRRVRPHIANEARIFEALEKYYGYECPSRYGHLLDRLNRSRYLWDESAKLLLEGAEQNFGFWSADEVFTAIDTGTLRTVENLDLSSNDTGRGDDDAAAPGPATPPPGIGDDTAPISRHALAAGLERERPPEDVPWTPPPLTSPAEGSPTEASSPDPPATTAAPSGGNGRELPALRLDDVERFLAGDPDHEALGDILLRFFVQSFDRAGLFRARRHNLTGWRGTGVGVDAERFGAIEIPLDEPSIFLDLLRGEGVHLGPLPPVSPHRRLVSQWGGSITSHFAVVPIRVRERLVMVLLGERVMGADGTPSAADCRRLAAKASLALELCILRRKMLS